MAAFAQRDRKLGQEEGEVEFVGPPEWNQELRDKKRGGGGGKWPFAISPSPRSSSCLAVPLSSRSRWLTSKKSTQRDLDSSRVIGALPPRPPLSNL